MGLGLYWGDIHLEYSELVTYNRSSIIEYELV